MKSFLIIPMGGRGNRFLNAGYKTYKPFLPVDNKNIILDNIINNFSNFNSELIVLTNLKYLKEKNIQYLKKRKCKLIHIPSHKKGPMHSILLGLPQINKIVKKNKNIFICYSDIIWKWKPFDIKKKISRISAAIFTHTGFHPHLDINSKSDFCLKRNNRVMDISEKKTFTKDYRKELLAIGCYYFNNLNLLNSFFKNNKLSNKKENYLTRLIKYLLKKKIIIKPISVKKFVHLGFPEQYEDYTKWRKYNQILKNKKRFKQKKNTIMLMGGKGKRLSSITKFKPFLLINNRPIYEYIFDQLNSKEKIIITNHDLKKKFNNKKYKFFTTKQTNSMFDTILSAKNFIKHKSNYFLTSCDCLGISNEKKLEKFINKNKSDLIFFTFNFSYLQKNLGNSHSRIIISKNKKVQITVKSQFKGKGFGHAGYFWIKNPKVFQFLDTFKKSNFCKRLNRELLLDDYFKYLVDRKKITSSYYLLDDYIHIGSEKEYREYNYWNNYFNEKKYF